MNGSHFTLRVTLLVSEKVKLLNRGHAGCGRKEPLCDPDLRPCLLRMSAQMTVSVSEDVLCVNKV